MYLEPEVIEELEQGRMIKAIKVLRAQREIGLKEAKMQIDEYLEQNPYLKIQESKMSFEPIFLLVVIFIAYALYRILFLSQ